VVSPPGLRREDDDVPLQQVLDLSFGWAARFWLSASDYGRLMDNFLVLGSDRVGPAEGQKA
jgi:hypothetical protein